MRAAITAHRFECQLHLGEEEVGGGLCSGIFEEGGDEFFVLIARHRDVFASRGGVTAPVSSRASDRVLMSLGRLASTRASKTRVWPADMLLRNRTESSPQKQKARTFQEAAQTMASSKTVEMMPPCTMPSKPKCGASGT